MKEKNSLLIILISALFITILFHKQSLGINLLIFESIMFAYFMLKGQFRMRGKYALTIGSGLIITAISSAINDSGFSYFVNILILILFVGLLTYPNVRSLWSALGLSFANVIYAQKGFIQKLGSSQIAGQDIGKRIIRLSVFIIPLIIIMFFVAIYSSSNPVFEKLVADIGNFLNFKFLSFFEGVSLMFILTFLLGLLISNFIFIRIPEQSIIDIDIKYTDALSTQKILERNAQRGEALRNEYRSGIFLFAILNAVLLVLNIADIKWVWLNFSWEGQYLKQFVHEGTYLLIWSILISIALVLYYFRAGLNYYPKNALLKYLSLVWLAQNTVLAISVGIRNYWYIEYFSLAYKRIGVIIFLLMVIYGLYSVFVKVRKKKSLAFLLRTNAYAILIILMVSSVFNWDNIIARYNFAHADESFLHLDFMSKLPDKSLPYLDRSIDELRVISEKQKTMFPFEKKYMSTDEYYKIIEQRKAAFKISWEEKGFFSWNLSEYQAYQRLFREP